MELNDFSLRDQEAIRRGIPTAVITDKEAAAKILALVPQEWIQKIPFFVRRHATTKTIEKIATEHPELYAAAKKTGELPAAEREALRTIITDIFRAKMKKHAIQ